MTENDIRREPEAVLISNDGHVIDIVFGGFDALTHWCAPLLSYDPIYSLGLWDTVVLRWAPPLPIKDFDLTFQYANAIINFGCDRKNLLNLWLRMC